MSTEVLTIKKNSLSKELALLNAPETYITGIMDAEIISRDELKITVERPSTGTGIQYGGVAYVFDGITGKKLKEVKAPGSDAKLEINIQDSALDFTENYYVIGYGPNNVDQGVNATAATVRVIQGEIEDFNASICFKLNAQNNRVTGRYSVPTEFVNVNSLRAYLVEGSELKDTNHAVANVVVSPGNTQHISLEFPNGTLEVGKTYTLCLNVYSWTREIAGQTFVFN